MLETKLERITGHLCQQLLQGQSEIAFRDLINRPLPSYFWDFFKLILDPRLGERVQIGKLILDISSAKRDPDKVKELKDSLTLSARELVALIRGGLDSRFQFILSPSNAMANSIYGFRAVEEITSQELISSLEALEKLLEGWSPIVLQATMVIKPFILSKAEVMISKSQFNRVLASAIEKEAANRPLQWIKSCLIDLKSLLQLDPQQNAREQADYIEAIDMVLDSRGLASWKPAVLVEKDLTGDNFNIDMAIKSLIRLNIYFDHGLFGDVAESAAQLDEEIESFTGFIEEETK